MIHSFTKLLSKILALRLAPKLNELVDKNQNAFIRSRAIQDNFKYIQRALVLIRKKKIPTLLLKLDISKAFDTLSWPFLLEVMQARGFGHRYVVPMDLSAPVNSVVQDNSQQPPGSTKSRTTGGCVRAIRYRRYYLLLQWTCCTG